MGLSIVIKDIKQNLYQRISLTIVSNYLFFEWLKHAYFMGFELSYFDYFMISASNPEVQVKFCYEGTRNRTPE